MAVDMSFRDPSLGIEERITILLNQMTLPEKAGLFFHSMITVGPDGELAGPVETFDTPSTEVLVTERFHNHFNLFGAANDPVVLARWHNKIQELALNNTRLGIPITISTDPRHHFTDNPGAAFKSGAFSEWPEPLGLAAIRDSEVVERFGQIARQEYLAVGIRVALHPQVDLATEPRWARQFQTFGEDPQLTALLGAAYVRGFQGEQVGPQSVACMAKHFPGGGPQLDGEDPHFSYGREQVYPGKQWDLHLIPFEAVLSAGTSQIMPYYGMPVGTTLDEVGFAFNKQVITGLLREKYGFDGIVCTDWGLITDHTILGDKFVARAWGVEDLSRGDRMKQILDAGCDQFGGERCSDLLIELVENGEVSHERLDVSARRLLREKFVLGLFDSPFIDVDQAAEVVGRTDFVMAGFSAQRDSVVLLENEDAMLPLSQGITMYVEGVDPEVAARYGTVTDDPSKADVAIIRINAPYDTRSTAFENLFHAGSLNFPAETIDKILALSEQVPVVLDVFCDRPAILTPFAGRVRAMTATYGVSGPAMLDVLFGVSAPKGKLPTDLPRSMAAIAASRSDVPFDTEDPLFKYGHGLTYPSQG